MDRSAITLARNEMLKAANDVPPEQTFAALTLRAEANLRTAIQDAREVVGKAATAAGGFAKLTNPGGAEVPLLEDAAFLIEGMRQAKDMVFRDENRVDIGVGGGRVNKVSRRLFCATEGYEAALTAIYLLGGALEERYAGFSPQTYFTAAKAILSIAEWDKMGWGTLEGAPYALNVLRGVEQEGAVSLTLFVCPPAEFGYLRSDEPELYLRTSVQGSLLSAQAPDLRELFVNLKRSGVPIQLNVLIGDADENDYIWPALGKPAALSEEKLAPRREELAAAVRSYVLDKIAQTKAGQLLSEGQINVISLAATAMPDEAAQTYVRFVEEPQVMGRYLRQFDLQDERDRMLELWQPGDYYDGLPRPEDRQLDDIILRKFAAYAMQGVYLGSAAPNSILIQTERPPLMRTRMMNTGRNVLSMPEIPAIYQNLSDGDLDLELYGGLEG